MSRGFRDDRTRKAAHALLLAAAALALPYPCAPAAAQDTELRGFVSDTAIEQDRERKTRDLVLGSGLLTGNDAPAAPAELPVPYQPVSAGAVPDQGSAAAGPADLLSGASADEADDEPAAKVAGQRKGAKKPAAKGAASETSEADASAGQEPQGPANPRATTVDAAEKTPFSPRADRTGAIERGNRTPEEDPFAAVGIRVGTFTLRPSIEQGVVATNNADSSVDGKSAVLSRTTLRFEAESGREGNSATVSGYGIFRKTLSGQEVKDAQGRLDGRLDLDLGHDWRAVARLGYEAAPESADSPVVIEDTVSQPLRQSFDGSLGVLKDIGKVRLGLTGAARRDTYGDAELASGAVLSQKDRDSTLYTATLRGGYEISPALTPFAELEAGRRAYDLRADAAGYERSSTRLGARGGLALDLGEKLGGEVSAGWIRESFDDDRLAPLAGATVAADLRWSPQRGTIVGLRGDTTLEDTTNAGESGSILYAGRLTAEHRLRANLTANAELGAGWRDYLGSGGHDLIYSAEAGLTWWLNRNAGVTASARHETVTSSLPDRDSRTDSVYLGLTLRR